MTNLKHLERGRSGRVLALALISGLALCAPSGTLVAQSTQNAAQPHQAGRERLLGRMLAERPQCCFVEHPTQDQLDTIIRDFGLYSPVRSQDRFEIFNENVWQGAGTLGPRGRSLAAQLTYSFPTDGVTWGDGSVVAGGPNTLNDLIDDTFGVANRDRGRELIRQAFASWRKYTGLTYSESPDDNVAMSNVVSRVSTRGDIRIGAVSSPTLANSGVLAFNFTPGGGADMTLIAEQFVGLGGSGSNFRLLRNVAGHEHGHGLGFEHVVPCNASKLMEPFASLSFDMLRIDDRRGGQWNYGDRYAGNTTSGNAKNFGDLTAPSVRSVIERDLSTNRTTGSSGTSSDWFAFTLSSAQSVTITVTPTGGTYNQGEQTGGGCQSASTALNASSVGNLNIELRSNNAGTLLQSANTAAAGQVETIATGTLLPSTYWVRVTDSSASTSDRNQALQLYDLTIRVGTSTAPPLAIAGVNKRVVANTNCFFMGNVNSEASEGTLTGFSWDFDGDGVFDSNSAQPNTQYPSNGVYSATLRVTDSNGSSDTDTILVTVFGATTSITSVTPGSGAGGSSTPVTIVGTNFKGVTSAAQISVGGGGGGVSVTGTPVVNTLGTQITGLSLVVAPGATPGVRSLTVSNSDGAGGSASLATAFTVSGVIPGNDECSGAQVWGTGGGSKAFSNVNATASTPQFFTGTGCTGNIHNDVWYTWTIGADAVVTVTTDSAPVAGFSSRVAVYANSCPIGAPIQCGEFGQAYTFSAQGGQTYLFRVGSAVPNQTGAANVILAIAEPSGACCAASGACAPATRSLCEAAGSAFQGSFTSCTPALCPLPNGACCLSDGSCIDLISFNCDANAGTWLGLGSTCAASSCQPTGACCDGSTCTLSSADACVGTARSYRGNGTSCNPPGNATAPCCRADFDQSGVVSTQDIFDFLAAWFGGSIQSDVDASQTITTQDIFDFLAAWFAGC